MMIVTAIAKVIAIATIIALAIIVVIVKAISIAMVFLYLLDVPSVQLVPTSERKKRNKEIMYK